MDSFRDMWKFAVRQLGQMNLDRGSAKQGVDPKIIDLLQRVSAMSNAGALTTLESTEVGLSAEQVETRRDIFGPNAVAHEKPIHPLVMLFANFKNPFIVVLLLLGLVSYLTNDVEGASVVALMVVVSVIMRFFQEYRSSRAAETLKAMVSTTATVTRTYLQESILPPKSEAEADAAEPEPETLPPVAVRLRREIPFAEVVPGDIIHLSAGDMVPADVRLLTSKDIFISESALTGEAMPVEKYDTVGNVREKSTQANSESQSVMEKGNLCFLGTNVVSGSATAVVISTGEQTFFGSLAKSIVGHRSLTSFDKGVNSVTWLLVRFMLVMVPVVFVMNGYLKGNWQEAFLFAIAVAVGLTPEMLPMVVTANLAKGAVAMSERKVIVKRLNSIQNLGAMDILCTDKTGTLTQDKIILKEHLNIHGEDDPRVLKYAFLNSYYQTGLKNLLDRAVLEHFELSHELELPKGHEKIDEVPFDFVRRRMSVITRKPSGVVTLICKGAFEEILSISSRVEFAGQVVELTPELRRNAFEIVREKNEAGSRVVAVAYKQLETHSAAFSTADETELILMGFIAFLDPPKETASEAIRLLHANGVAVKILTGDNAIVTARVCREVGIQIGTIALGGEIEHLTEDELADLAERTTVFAKLAPAHKARIVRALQRKGHTVGFMGDGINDAPALRDSDVGISVDTATDIARESADIILLEKSLLVLEEGVIKGREVYGNIIKYIKMTASSNFGNVFSVLIASAFIPFLPMLPVQILVQNLLYDFSQTALPWDKMDKEFLERPRKWEPTGIARFMIFIGPVSSVFDVLTFAVMWYVFKANSPGNQAIFQSGWFIEGLLSQTLVVHMIRTQKIPFLQSTAAFPVLATTIAIVGIGCWLPFSSLGATLGLRPLPWTYFPYLFVMLIAYCALAQLVKTWYIRRFSAWL